MKKINIDERAMAPSKIYPIVEPSLVKTIAVSQSEKIQAESFGGPKYTSYDLYESESEQVRADLDAEDCEIVWNELRSRVESRIQERKNALIAQLKAGNPPF